MTEEQTSIVEQAFLLLARLRVERAAYAKSRAKGWLTVSEAALCPATFGLWPKKKRRPKGFPWI